MVRPNEISRTIISATMYFSFQINLKIFMNFIEKIIPHSTHPNDVETNPMTHKFGRLLVSHGLLVCVRV